VFALGCCGAGCGGRDWAAGWRGLRGIRGAPLDETVVLPRAPYREAELLGHVESLRLDEISGMAPSQRRDDLLWVINDGARTPHLHALSKGGEDRGFVLVSDVDPVDWESMAHFTWQGRPYLLVADVGDNFSWRRQVELLVIEEPEFAGEQLPAGATVGTAWRIPFRYPEGPRDCEAVAVDRDGDRVLLISKRTQPPVLYELPLFPVAGADPQTVQLAKRLGTLPGIPPPNTTDVARHGFFGRFVAMPAGLDLSADGRAAAVISYRDAYLFERAEGEGWAAAFARTPRRLGLPEMDQAEAIVFEPSGRALLATSEGSHPPIYRSRP
jgi:hypothetical protein